jgi:hypothetical protein
MNTHACPSELVVAQALRNTFPGFLVALAPTHFLKKFLGQYLDAKRCPGFALAS